MNEHQNKPISKIVKPIGGMHGISAIFPKFKDVIDYEENRIILNRGYPRFVTHPFVRKIENTYKTKFNALEALSCHSFEAAIFLVFDYVISENIKIYISKGHLDGLYKYFDQRFPNLLLISTISEADILILDKDEIIKDLNYENKVIIGIVENPPYNLNKNIDNLDFIIFQDKENDIGIILCYRDTFSTINLLRRHSGLVANSRKICNKKKINDEIFSEIEGNLKNVLSKLELTDSKNCFLVSSGMAAVFFAIYSLISPKKSRFIALGSLYVDTIRILEKWPQKYGMSETIFIRNDFEEKLNNFIDENTAGIILEFPTNPLIQLNDIEKIISIAHSKGVKVIVDNTVATPYNFNPFSYNVDLIVHSTTKFLNGRNNHIGGALLTRDPEIKKKIKDLKQITNLNMCYDEMKTLSRNIRNFDKRMENINRNALKIAQFLNTHPSVDTVYYPILKNSPDHKLATKYLRGGSGLISFTLKNSSYQKAEGFYDNLHQPILKGPSLGSEKTLLSPYIVMAHYNDSKEMLKKQGFDFYLMRLSVGVEPVEYLIYSLENALKFV